MSSDAPGPAAEAESIIVSEPAQITATPEAQVRSHSKSPGHSSSKHSRTREKEVAPPAAAGWPALAGWMERLHLKALLGGGMNQQLKWGASAAAVLLIGGLFFQAISKSQSSADLAEDTDLIAELSDLTENLDKPDPLAESTDSADSLRFPAPGGNDGGPALVMEVPGPSRTALVDSYPGDTGETNRQAVHFSPSDETGSRRAVLPAEYQPNRRDGRPAAWLAGTIEDDSEESFQRKAYDRSGSRAQ